MRFTGPLVLLATLRSITVHGPRVLLATRLIEKSIPSYSRILHFILIELLAVNHQRSDIMLRYGLKSFCSSPCRLSSYRSSVNSGVFETIRTVKTVVWWDMNCSAPEDYLCTIYDRIDTALKSRGMQSPIWVKAYANYSNEVTDAAQEAFNSSGVHLIHVPRCETTSSLLQKHIMIWSTYNSPPAHVMLISNDKTLASVVQQLRRLKFVVILSCDMSRTRKFLCKSCTFVWPWKSLSKGLTFDAMQFNEVPDMIYWIREANRKSANLTKTVPKSIEPKETANAKLKADSDLECVSTAESSPASIEMEPLVYEGTIKYCKTAEEIDASIANFHEILSTREMQSLYLGFDSEWKPHGRDQAYNKTAVVQVQVKEEFLICCYVMQISNSGIPLSLKHLLENKQYIKVGMGIRNDVSKMAKDYDIQVQPVIDLCELAATKFVETNKKWGLSSLTAMVLQKKLEKPKEIATSNWEVNVLTKEQLMHAAKDAYASLCVYQALTELPNVLEE